MSGGVHLFSFGYCVRRLLRASVTACVGYCVQDAMEATDEALARKEQEAAYMVDGEI